MQNHRVIFFGTPKIAAKCLETLFGLPIEVCAVVTKPDRPVGRGNEIIFSEVKQFSIEKKIKIFQPNSVGEIITDIQNLKPDLILTCAYGKIIPREIFSFPKFGCINVHASLLPKYRGGAPIHHVIINNERETGISLMYTIDKLDAGDVLYQEKISIDHAETYKTLYDKLTLLAQKILCEKINFIFENEFHATKQDEQLVSFAKNISRENEQINWNKPANEIDCLIRGLYDSPIAFTVYNGINIKIFQARQSDQHLNNARPGEIMEISSKGILVATTKNAILLEIIQMPSKKPIHVGDMLNGNHRFKLGDIFE